MTDPVVDQARTAGPLAEEIGKFFPLSRAPQAFVKEKQTEGRSASHHTDHKKSGAVDLEQEGSSGNSTSASCTGQ